LGCCDVGASKPRDWPEMTAWQLRNGLLNESE
jgi:hypothetical protein